MTTADEVSTKRATSRRLIGREHDFARLEASLDEAIAGSRALAVFVEGEAGIGKTRTVQEFASRAEARGANVLVGHCVAHGELILPYAPLVEMLSDLVDRLGARDVVGLAGPTAPELTRWVPALTDVVAAPERTPASASRLFQAVRAVLDGLSAQSPVVVIIEDLHWADRSTLELLALLSTQLRGNALLVFTVRSDESPDEAAVMRFIAETGRGSGRHVALEPLTRGEQALQLSDILGVPPRATLLDEVYRRAEGNPFFAEELLALGSDGDLPATIRALLLARLDALPPPTRQALRAVSVVGRRVPHRLLDRVADASGPALDAALRPAVENHVLLTDAADGGSYVFRHALLQEAVAGGLLPGESARIHRRIAKVLTESPELAGDAGSVAGRVARHWDAAGDGRQALSASIDAAREAAGALAFSESLSHYERAVALLDSVPEADGLLDEPRSRLLWSAADVAHLTAQPRRAAELIRAAIAAVDPAEEHLRGLFHERLGRYLWMAAEGEQALEAYERAVEIVPAEPDTSERAAVLSGYSQVLMLAGRVAESEPWARQAIQIARRLPGARSIEGRARNMLGVDLAYLGRVDEGIEELMIARRIADEEFDDVDEIARARVNLYSVLFDSGRLSEAAEVAIDAIAVSEALGLQRRKGVWCRCDAATVLLHLGRNDHAERLLDEAVALEPQGIDAVSVDVVRGMLLLRLGELDQAHALLEHARHAGARLLDPQLLGPLYATLVEVLVAKSAFDEALVVADEGRRRLGDDGPAVFSVPLFSAAAIAAVQSRSSDRHVDLDAARGWVDLSEAALRGSAMVAPMAAARHAAAACELSEAEGECDAQDWLAIAEQWSRLPEPYQEGQARLRAASLMLANPADRATATAELRIAWSVADRIGARGLRKAVEDVARRARITLGEPVRRDDDDPYRLTPRERDVLALVAEGLTDRTIGTRLFISHRTVERHVSNLLAKFDAGRRSELTAIAHRLGLAARN